MNQTNLNWMDNKVFNAPARQKGPGGRGPGRNAGQSVSPPPRRSMQKDAMDAEEMLTQQGPPASRPDASYIQDYLIRNIGRNVRAEFVLGTSQFMDKSGILREVGINYFVLEDYISHAMVMCDLYSVKFVTTL